MTGHAAGRVVGWKRNCPRHVGRFAVAAAVEQTACAAKNTSERDAWRKNVGSFPQRQFFPANINTSRDNCSNQSAVINESAVLNHENFREWLVGKFFFPVSR